MWIFLVLHLLLFKLVLGQDSCSISRGKVAQISQWSNQITLEEDEQKAKELIEAEEVFDKVEAINEYYESITKTMQSHCNIFKRIAGHWKDRFLDGEKLICMDGIYKAILNQTCLVYSLGVGDDWDFELFMAELGNLDTKVSCLDQA